DLLGPHPLVRDGVPPRQARGGLGPGRARRAALRGDPLRRLPLPRGPVQVHAHLRLPDQGAVGRLLGRTGDDALSHAALGLVPGARALHADGRGRRGIHAGPRAERRPRPRGV
ncbi:MAG: hypothetical protein AVDCRST_MAG53-218, partial [uncultured Solirubrobacteraceae bacterium]